jgi:oligosaccharide repeat unit polymerase
MISIFSGFDNLLHMAVNLGNVPNIPIVMQIGRDWSRDIGYMNGKSLISWIYSIFPSSFKPDAYQLGTMIKLTWYKEGWKVSQLPPTGIGEMYANFGFLGPIVGMMFFGMLCGFLYNYLIKSRSFWILVIYSNILLSFILIYPKGEFINLSLLPAVPIAITILGIKMVAKASRNISLRRCGRGPATPL